MDGIAPLPPPPGGFPRHITAQAESLLRASVPPSGQEGNTVHVSENNQSVVEDVADGNSGGVGGNGSSIEVAEEVSSVQKISDGSNGSAAVAFVSPQEYLATLQRRLDVLSGPRDPRVLASVADGEINPSSGTGQLAQMLCDYHQRPDLGGSADSSDNGDEHHNAERHTTASGVPVSEEHDVLKAVGQPLLLADGAIADPGERKSPERTIADYDPRFDPVGTNCTMDWLWWES